MSTPSTMHSRSHSSFSSGGEDSPSPNPVGSSLLSTPSAGGSPTGSYRALSVSSRSGGSISSGAPGSPVGASGSSSPQGIPIGNITLNDGTKRGVYIYLVNDIGQRIDLPAGFSISLDKTPNYLKIFQDLVDKAPETQQQQSNLTSISSEGYTFNKNSHELLFHNRRTFAIWQRFSSLILNGNETPQVVDATARIFSPTSNDDISFSDDEESPSSGTAARTSSDDGALSAHSPVRSDHRSRSRRRSSVVHGSRIYSS